MRIVARKGMTVEQLRERLNKAMSRTITTRTECRHCDGKGHTEKTAPISQSDVARATGLHTSTVSAFLRGRASVTLEKGLALIGWVLEQEGTNVDLRSLAGARSPEEREREAAQRRAVQAVSSRAAIDAAIDGINRPMNGGGASMTLLPMRA